MNQSKWYIVDDIFDTISRKIIKDYEDIYFTTINACWYRNNYQVKSEMMHLNKRKAYLNCNLGTRRCQTFNIKCCPLTKMI